MTYEDGTKYLLLAPSSNRKGEHKDLIENLRRSGFARVRLNGDVRSLDDDIQLEKNRRNRLDVVVDRLVARPNNRPRVTDSVETALQRGKGKLVVSVVGGDGDELFSEHLYCDACRISFPELAPQSFSFNSPLGMCQSCNGLGTALRIDPERVIPDPSKALKGGAIKGFNLHMARWFKRIMETVARVHKIDLDAPFESLSKAHTELMLYGDDSELYSVNFRRGRRSFTHPCQWEGIVPRMERLWRETNEDQQLRYASFFTDSECDDCNGSRLRPESRAVKLEGESIVGLNSMIIQRAHDFLKHLKLEGNMQQIAAELLKEIVGRLRFYSM